MLFLAAGVLAAAVSWIGNWLAIKTMGAREIVMLAPLIEEAAKTGSAVLTGSSLILTHAAFGLIEGFYDAWDAGLQGLQAGAASLAGHLFYGYVTFLVMQRHNSLLYAVLSGYLLHMLWNAAVLKFLVKKGGRTA
ncbi:hypothetical protein [Phosphitispora sp. TUW77]|uniref:hypothetical protein n=1 Tax=Phosphitispora sp. TUW77 TaxID=3152361 RepID=UPI003AB7D5EB